MCFLLFLICFCLTLAYFEAGYGLALVMWFRFVGVVRVTKKDNVYNCKSYDCEGKPDCSACDYVVKIYHIANFSLIPTDTVNDNIAKRRDNSKSVHAKRKNES